MTVVELESGIGWPLPLAVNNYILPCEVRSFLARGALNVDQC